MWVLQTLCLSLHLIWIGFDVGSGPGRSRTYPEFLPIRSVFFLSHLDFQLSLTDLILCLYSSFCTFSIFPDSLCTPYCSFPDSMSINRKVFLGLLSRIIYELLHYRIFKGFDHFLYSLSKFFESTRVGSIYVSFGMVPCNISLTTFGYCFSVLRS